MYRTVLRKFATLVTLALVCSLSASLTQAQNTAFTYQGRLTDSSLPANGAYDFQFKLFDAVSGGAQVGTTGTLNEVMVNNGVFSVALDFGATVFPGANRWLEIAVRLGASTGAYTTLTPRQRFTSTPYAIKSLNADTADSLSAACTGCVTSSQINDINSSQINGALSGSQLTVPLSLSGNVAQIISATNTSTTGGAIGVSSQSNSSSGGGVAGYATSTTGSTYGVFGQSASSTGSGVYGLASSATGLNAGVRGANSSSSGYGVIGQAFGAAGTTYGVYGQATSTGGTGVFGWASSNTGPVKGVLGQSTSSSGTGVYGQATSTSGSTYGVFGQSDSNEGIGVQGYAPHATGMTVGVFGRSDSSNGQGILGQAVGSTGANYGVHGQTNSASGAGVRAEGAGPSGTALQIESGAIKVLNAGIGTSTTVFIHQVTAANTAAQRTTIDHPMVNAAPNAILIITQNFNPGGGLGVTNPHPLGVSYNSSSQKWEIFNADGAALPTNTYFNVLIVKP